MSAGVEKNHNAKAALAVQWNNKEVHQQALGSFGAEGSGFKP